MKYLFLSYINRSGSTYFANEISRSATICVCPEAEILYDLFLRSPQRRLSKNEVLRGIRMVNNDKKFKAWKFVINETEYQTSDPFKLFCSILEGFRKKYYPKAAMILFKHNYLYRLLHYPEIRSNENIFWINLIRDPRAIYASQKRTISPFTKKVMSKNPVAFIDNWNDYAGTIGNTPVSRNRIIVKYETLISHFDDTMEKTGNRLQNIFSWNDIRHAPQQLANWISEEYNAIHKNINEPPQSEYVNAWRSFLSKYELMVIHSLVKPNPFYEFPAYKEFVPGYFFYVFYQRILRKITYLRHRLSRKRKI